jgi:hypothetical protein
MRAEVSTADIIDHGGVVASFSTNIQDFGKTLRALAPVRADLMKRIKARRNVRTYL